MPRIFAVAILFWGWAYLCVMYVIPVFHGGTINVGRGMGLAATVVFAVWVLCSTAIKLLFALDICSERWFKASLFTNSCLAVYLVILLFGSPAEISQVTYFWYHQVLWFGLAAIWPIFDVSLYFGTRHLK